ncbi:hypothetical protein ACWDYH_03860 [Nocardia goodfellowii]
MSSVNHRIDIGPGPAFEKAAWWSIPTRYRDQEHVDLEHVLAQVAESAPIKERELRARPAGRSDVERSR